MNGGRGIPPFRHRPPDLAPGLIVRPRLIEILRRRFDERLTLVFAGAGFGKTTLLLQAIEENRHERLGEDIWLRVGERDHDPEHLLAGLYRSITGRSTRRSITAQDIVDLLAQRPPASIVLVLDDVHLLGSQSGLAWRVLTQLLEQLPDTAHLVLSGRSVPSLGIGGRHRPDDVIVIDETLLAFDDTELRRVAPGLSAESRANLPRWPALTALSSELDREACIEFVKNEIVSTLHPERARLLALLAPFGVLDDAIVAAVAGTSAWTAKRAVAGLPLISPIEGGYELHQYWTDALASHVDVADRDEALARGARLLLDRGQHVKAARAASLAGDRCCLLDAVRHHCQQPLLGLDTDDTIALQDLLPASPDAAAAELLLEAVRRWATSERIAAQIFERAAIRAQECGDEEIEALARWRLVQLRYLSDHEQLVVDDRIAHLAESGVSPAMATVSFIRSVQAQNIGAIDDALRELGNFAELPAAQRQVTIAERLVDLGRPEQVPAAVESLLSADEVDVFGAQALWLQGSVSPELAWDLAKAFPGIATKRGAVHEIVSVHGVVATVAIAAGHDDEAEALLGEARRLTGSVGDHVAVIVDVAEAMHALCHEGEDRAVEFLRIALDRVPIGQWPARGHLHGLAMLRALMPETSETLDQCDLGPALRTAVAAGAAIDAVRSRSTKPAAALDWTRPDVLRAHVPPPLLTELAVAAISREVAEAKAVLRDIPSVRTWLGRLSAADDPKQASAAANLLAELVLDPGYTLRVRTLGGLTVERSDGRSLGSEWHRRQRVQDLFVYLLTHPHPTRKAVAAALWPNLPEAKAAGNLRVNLTHLHAALEPDRPAGARPYFIEATSSGLRLVRDAIEIDTDTFDRHIELASEAEAGGVPTTALREYLAASELYKGPYLQHVDDDWVLPERLRLHSLDHAALCRIGELKLARGKPEQAIATVVQALRLDPISERAHRLSIRCHLALGSETSARRAGRSLIDQLALDGLTPDNETRRLLNRLGDL